MKAKPIKDLLSDYFKGNDFKEINDTINLNKSWNKIVGETISKNTEIFEHFKKLYYHPNQKVRGMLIKALQCLFDHGIITDKEKLKNELNQIFVTSSNY